MASDEKIQSNGAGNASVWFARADIIGNEVHGFGHTPETAMDALVSAWRKLAQREDLDVDVLALYRDSVEVLSAAIGKGYAKGIGDSGWYDDSLNGSDPRFDGIIGEMERPIVTRRGPRV